MIVRDKDRVRASSLLGSDSSSEERGSGGTLTVNATESVEVSGMGTIGDTSVIEALRPSYRYGRRI